jgi:hypothetical protein
LVAGRAIGLEANADKGSLRLNLLNRMQYKIVTKITGNNKSLESVSKSEQLGTTLTNQNYIYEEIKGRLNSGNACYHSV